MRRLALLLFLLPAFAGGAKPLLKELKKYDPTVLAKDAETQERVSSIRKRYGVKAEKQLYEVKKQALDKRFARFTNEIEAVARTEDAAAAKALCELFVLVSELADLGDIRRDEAKKSWQSLVQGYEPGQTNHSISNGAMPLYHRHRTDEQVWREYSYSMLGLRLACARYLRAESARATLSVVVSRSRDPLLRAKAAEILSADSGADPEPIIKALKREREPGVQAAMLIALSRLDGARRLGADVAAHLGDSSERVRIAAARALERMHVVEGVGPLIDRMGQEADGLAKTVMARALESMTGQRFGTHPEAWRNWWSKHRDRLFAEQLPPRDDERRRNEGEGKGKGHFYGIPQVSKRIIYIIDVSGSMKQDVGGGKTRLEACKTELSRAISQLPRRASFNVLLYSHDVRTWKPTMVVAGPLKKGAAGNKPDAKRFFEKAEPKGNTNIYDALRRAFEIADGGSNKNKKKKNAPLAADTIYLLTDGAPTTPDGKPDDTKKILEGVRKWNALGQVTIHTIGIGKNLNSGFLRQLAEENNGRFIWKK